MSICNRLEIATRKQFKNFSIANNKISTDNLLFNLIKLCLDKVVTRFNENVDKSEQEKNIYLVVPAITYVYKNDILVLFNDVKRLEAII